MPIVPLLNLKMGFQELTLQLRAQVPWKYESGDHIEDLRR